MRVAMVADVHLGHRRYDALAPDGRKQREADVSAAWFAAVDGIVAAKPDLIMIGGDLFDSPRPGNLANRDAVDGCVRLRKVAQVLSVIGNHDRQKAEESGVGTPQAVLPKIGVKVVTGAEFVRIPHLNTTVLCVAERYIRRVKLIPNADEGTHLLLAHGAIGGTLAAVTDVLPAEAISSQFAAAFLGDYHVAQQVAENAWYPGSLEYVSSDSWSEIGKGLKGWLLWEDGVVTHHPVPTRPHFDLPRIDANGLSGKEVTAQILENIAAIDPVGAVVRQVVIDCHPATKSAIDYRTLKTAAAPMLAWRPDIRRSDHDERKAMMFVPNGPDPIDELNRDEPLPQSEDEFSLADSIMTALKNGGELPTIPNDLDPYGLDTPAPKMRARERAA